MIKKYNQYLKEHIDYSDIDPYGEEIWDEEELNPILLIAKKQGIPYDQITHLNCFDNDLTSLDGIENLINLKHLNCSNNHLTDLNGMKNLINLRELWCSNNNFSNEYKKYLRNYCKEKKIKLGI